MEIVFRLNNQIIARKDNHVLAAKSKNYVRARFELESDDWHAPITAIFGSYTVVLDENNSCTVPWEVLEQPGVFQVSAFCADLHTATQERVYVSATGYVPGETPEAPTPDVYSQFAQMVHSAVAQVKDIGADTKQSQDAAQDAAASAQGSAASAEAAKDAALQKAEEAVTASLLAVGKAQEALNSASGADASADEAQNSASQAAASAQSAAQAAQTAQSAAESVPAIDDLQASTTNPWSGAKVSQEVGRVFQEMNALTQSVFDVSQSKNLFDWDRVEFGKVIGSDGELISNTLRWTTDFIALTQENRSIVATYLFTASNGEKSRKVRVWTHMACYNHNKEYVEGTYSAAAISSYTATNEEIAYIRISFNPTQAGYDEEDMYLMLEYGTAETIGSAVDDYVPYQTYRNLKQECLPAELIEHTRKVIEIYADDGIDVFYQKMLQAYQSTHCDVMIERGTYNYTNALIEQIRRDGRRGVPIGGGCRYYFNGAKLYCEYTGENKADVVGFFSPLDSQNASSDYEIYNLQLVGKNVCYAIHDQADDKTESFCRHIYRNCYVELDNTALGAEGNALSKALGGGLGFYGEVILDHCVFKAANPAKVSSVQDDASFHGSAGAFTDATLIVDGCWFENRFRTSDLDGRGESYPKIIYTGNSSGEDANLVGTWDVRQWNNTVRA